VAGTLSPANVLIDGGRVKIADFGSAQTAGTTPMSPASLVTGTPGYLSPEQAAGLPVTPAGDLYSLGMIAYECLTGRPPFRAARWRSPARTWALRARDYPQVMQAAAGPVRVGVSLLTAEPARRMTTSPRRPLSLSSAAAVLHLRAAWRAQIGIV
jgi:eukaryotic-like serine/threonine-protein kinase